MVNGRSKMYLESTTLHHLYTKVYVQHAGNIRESVRFAL